MRPRIHPILVHPTQSIRSVMSVIEQAPKRQPEPAPAGIALVVDEHTILLGVVTDGDIRRAVLAQTDLELPVERIMNAKPIAVVSGLAPADIIRSVNTQLRERGLAETRMDRLIVVDTDHHPIDVVSSFELWRESEVGSRRVCIMGLGYVGLTLAIAFAESGMDVIGVEARESIADQLRRGEPHFHEHNLPTLLKKHVGKKMEIVTHVEQAPADMYVVAVGTPIDETSGEVLYGDIEKAAEQVGRVLKVGDLVVIRSTVPIGTCRERVIPAMERASGLVVGRDVSIVMAPERTIEGNAIEELRTLPQVIGGFDARSTDLASRLFRHIAPTIVTLPSLEAAEMVKLINNGFRDVVFGFANQIALVCNQYGLPASQIIKAANEGYPRGHIPQPSPGVGGICLRKDPYLLLASASKARVDVPLTRAARDINRSIPTVIAEKVARFTDTLGRTAGDMTIGFLGLAFKGKPETSDIRGSTAIDVLQRLRSLGFSGLCYGHDPLVSEEDVKCEGFIPSSIADVFRRADAVLLLNNHAVYRSLDFAALARDTRVRYVFDGWYLYLPQQVEEHGFYYDAVGRDTPRV